MFPGDAKTNISNGVVAHSELPGKLTARQSALFDHKNVGGGELGVSPIFPYRESAARHCVGYVVGVRPYSQTVRVNADRAVAVVKDLQPFGDRTKVDAMRDNVSLDYSLDGVGDTEDPVPSTDGSSSGPIPTAFFGRIAGHIPSKDFGLAQSLGTARTHRLILEVAR